MHYHINRTCSGTHKKFKHPSNIFLPLPFFLETREPESNTVGVLPGRNLPGKVRGELQILS